MGMNAPAAAQSKLPAGSGQSMFDHPVSCILLGLVILAAAAFGTQAQVLTTESIYGVYVPLSHLAYFGLYGQLKDLLSMHDMTLFLFIVYTSSWGVEFIQFVLSLGIEWPRHNMMYVRAFLYGSVGVVIINSIADLVYFSHEPLLLQVLSAAVTFLLTFGLTHAGLYLIIRKGIVVLIRGH